METPKKSLVEYGKISSQNEDYFRADLIELYNDYGGRAIILTSKYIYGEIEKYVTFGNIRVYDETAGAKTKFQLTYHVNFPRKLVEQFVTLSRDFHHKKFFLLCCPKLYNHYGDIRGGLDLITNAAFSPIIRAPDKAYEWQIMLQKMISERNKYNRQFEKQNSYTKEGTASGISDS